MEAQTKGTNAFKSLRLIHGEWMQQADGLKIATRSGSPQTLCLEGGKYPHVYSLFLELFSKHLVLGSVGNRVQD